MRGVQKLTSGWQMSYGSLREYYPTYESACKRRCFLVSSFGVPKKQLKERSGEIYGAWEVIGYTGRRIGIKKDPEVIARHIPTKNIRTMPLNSLISGKKYSIDGFSDRPHHASKTPAGKFAMSITINGKKYFLGNFETEELARIAYNKAQKDWLTENKVPIKKNDRGFPRGVTKHGNRYQARIRVNYKLKYLGTYNTVDEAIVARKAAEHKYLGGN
ncbi:hypothetical protein Lpp71_16129 [Lacticaseibacillus paracasei subsp. paracasei Lpp71]|uniref:AP2/ERF domain-containing protein n=1 Tax=Lacticaseibacillus paracasei subsp. paracasei Lpp71 TaxID=1256207 RepID=A0A8E0MDD8_LACPA|nr:hypothetical protein Lpp71_16129 [Lacticaseibacillus paracasei subsp. paracasei Lpp71]